MTTNIPLRTGFSSLAQTGKDTCIFYPNSDYQVVLFPLPPSLLFLFLLIHSSMKLIGPLPWNCLISYFYKPSFEKLRCFYKVILEDYT